MMKKYATRLTASALAVTLTAGLAATGASACCGLYVGSDVSANGSTYVGRSEDIGKLYDKVFDVHQAEDHAEGEMYEDTYGFSMPYPSHTYRYTVMRDSVNQGETMEDEEGNFYGEAYGESGMNEKGVSVSATVSTAYNDEADEADPLIDTGICEISLNTVILMQADSARDGVEKLAAIIDEYGAGECNSLTISDANEVWDFEIVSGHQYVAIRMPSDKVSVNPNMMLIGTVDVTDTENVVASPNLISLAEENGFLVTDENGLIDVGETYGEQDCGSGQYIRYWQGVNYFNSELAQAISPDYIRDEDGNKISTPTGPFDMFFVPDRQITTYEALRLLAYRGEGTAYDANDNGTAIGNARQAECHVFEIRSDMPDALATIQWQTMSRAEYSVYIPYYANLLTETSEIFHSDWVPSGRVSDISDLDYFPTDSAYWVYAAINDLCDNDRTHYGVNVKKFWAGYQQALIEQQEAVDADMIEIYNYSPALAEEKATELGKAVAEEAFGYAQTILAELQAFIADDTKAEDAVFMPSVLTDGVVPTYSLDMVGGTGLPSDDSDQSTDNSGPSTDNSDSSTDNSDPSTDDSNQSPISFTDVTEANWFYDAVNYVSEHNLMFGVGDNLFDPQGTATRGMIVSVLYRMAGSPAVTGTSGFTDVADDAWYADAVTWAAANGIAAGYGDGTFGPNDAITREQLVSFLYRSVSDPEIFTGELTYADADQISAYAVKPMTWAVATGIITGKGDMILDPLGTATRAEIAQVLKEFCLKIPA